MGLKCNPRPESRSSLVFFVKFRSLVRLQLRALASLQSLELEPTRTCFVLGDGLMGVEGSGRICGREARLWQTVKPFRNKDTNTGARGKRTAQA